MSNELETWISGFYELNPDAIPTDTSVKKKKASVPLADELMAMDYGNMSFYKNLTDEQKKEISIWVLMRFMSSTKDSAEHHIMMVNDLVNHNFNSLSKHPELQWKLLALCGTRKKQFHPWIAPPKGIKKNRKEEAVLAIYPLLKDSDLELLLRINTDEDLAEFFRETGYDDKTIKEIMKSDAKAK